MKILHISIILFIILIFLYVNHLLRKRFEHFRKKPNEETVCGTKGNKCVVYASTGINSCCEGYKCILPNGNFHDKICMSDNDYDIGNINLPKSQRLDIFDIEFPTISVPVPKVFTSSYWNNLMVSSCPANKT